MNDVPSSHAHHAHQTGRRDAPQAPNLDHRIETLRALVQALTTLSGNTAEIADSRIDLLPRLRAVAGTQAALEAAQGKEVRIKDMLEAELVHYSRAHTVVSIVCEDIHVRGDTALHLAFLIHELAINAAAHGALAPLGGRLCVVCASSADGGGILDWRETVAEAAAPAPPNLGFAALPCFCDELGVRAIRAELRPDGLQAHIAFALSDAV